MAEASSIRVDQAAGSHNPESDGIPPDTLESIREAACQKLQELIDLDGEERCRDTGSDGDIAASDCENNSKKKKAQQGVEDFRLVERPPKTTGGGGSRMWSTASKLALARLGETV